MLRNCGGHIMIENLGHSHLAAFAGTPGWGGLTGEERSLFEAYLRRSENWSIIAFLRAIGREATIATHTLMPPPAPAAALPAPAAPPAGPAGPVPIPYPSTMAPVAAFDPTAGIVPPSFTELAAAREAADHAFKRASRQRSAAGQAAGGYSAVTLTAGEIQTATMLGRQWSAQNSGHGRDAHGSYASSSSPHTADRDRQRSEQAAIQREIDKALKRKRKTGNAFSN